MSVGIGLEGQTAVLCFSYKSALVTNQPFPCGADLL